MKSNSTSAKKDVDKKVEIVSSQRVQKAVIEDEMKTAYLDYAMSVIVGRALPDVRDGLKPVHRRILYAMNDMGLVHTKSFKKSARIVGEVLGKYHPHGDSAVYDSLVRMAQPFSLRYPLVRGQGNFGSVDGDSAAAMRYTEAKLEKISADLLADIGKETVDFRENFDGSLEEPVVLPTKIPHLLINGSNGIAVGMATNIPPHNVSEVIDATIAYLDDEDIDVAGLMNFIKGPDFPTGGTILGKNGILQAYAHGRGKIKTRAVMDQETVNGKNAIIITEIPYLVNKAALLEQIAGHVRDGKIEGISDIRDESDRDGMRVVIELKRDANPEVVQNQLFKHSRLQTSTGIILLALVNNQPKVLSLKELLCEFVKHRKEVVTRRTQFELTRAQNKAHLLEGLTKALDHIDEIIALIKQAKNAALAKEQLLARYQFSELQAQAILDMKLQKLTGLEREKIREEYENIIALIKELEEILASEHKIKEVVRKELLEMKALYGDARQTTISDMIIDDIEDEDLIPQEDQVVTITKSGYAKRLPLDTYKVQNRGGRGVIGAKMKEEDVIEHFFIANTHDYLLIFTTKGQAHWVKVYKLPEGSRTGKGKAIVNLISLGQDEDIAAVIPVDSFPQDQYLVMATRNGIVKKTSLEAYSRPRQNGIIGITLDDGDRVVDVKKTTGNDTLLLATKKGQACKFSEQDVRSIGRTSRGVRGISLAQDDQVINMVVPGPQDTIFTVTQNGYGKRTPVEDYRLISRGGKGVRNIICSPRNGVVASVRAVSGTEELFLISTHGITIRTCVDQISVIGRNTQGVRVMNLSDGDTVKKVAVCDVEHVAQEAEKK